MRSGVDGVEGEERSMVRSAVPLVVVRPPKDVSDILHTNDAASEAGWVAVTESTELHTYRPPTVALHDGVVAMPAIVTVEGATKSSSEMIDIVRVSPSVAYPLLTLEEIVVTVSPKSVGGVISSVT